MNQTGFESGIMSYHDKDHPGNSPRYHTGERCIECGIEPAGTSWSPFWCYKCNAKRLDRISEQFEKIKEGFK